ncbi:MAG: SEC-C metal-binding domain-containing protein [Persicimonas sp.]
MSEEKSNPNEVDARIQALFDEAEALSAQSRQRIVDLGEAAGERLVAIVSDQKLWDDQAPGGGFAPVHAAEILGEIGDEAAIRPLYRLLSQVDPDALLDDAIVDTLRSFDRAALDVGLKELESWDDPFLSDLAYVVAGLPGCHEKILQILLKYFIKNPVPGAELLAEYGDPTAVDALVVALDRYIAAAGGDPKYRRPIFTLAGAIEELGGELTAQQRRAVDLLETKRSASQTVMDKLEEKRRNAPDDSQTVKNPHDIGRNEPCWCGSGKKYKRCHWAEDQR